METDGEPSLPEQRQRLDGLAAQLEQANNVNVNRLRTDPTVDMRWVDALVCVRTCVSLPAWVHARHARSHAHMPARTSHMLACMPLSPVRVYGAHGVLGRACKHQMGPSAGAHERHAAAHLELRAHTRTHLL